MGILNKLLFWKRDDEMDFEKLANKEMNSDMPIQDNLGLDQKPAGLDEKSPFEDTHQPGSAPGQPQQQYPPYGSQAPPQQTVPNRATPGTGNRDLELINSKLDTLKAILTSLDQRMANIERSSGVEKKQERLW